MASTRSPAGRPPRYTSVEEMQAKIDAYFTACAGEPLLDESGTAVTDKYGEPVIIGAHPPTVTGLALALGFSGRQALLNYQARPKFMDAITRAKSRCEAYAEERLFDRDGARGAQFSLEHNFRWNTGNTAAEESEVKILDDL